MLLLLCVFRNEYSRRVAESSWPHIVHLSSPESVFGWRDIAITRLDDGEAVYRNHPLWPAINASDHGALSLPLVLPSTLIIWLVY